MSARVSLIVVAEPDDFGTRQGAFFASVGAQMRRSDGVEARVKSGCSTQLVQTSAKSWSVVSPL